jgi:hypothetical protein
MSLSREFVTRASDSVFLPPDLVERPDNPGGRLTRVLPEQHHQSLFEVAGEDALEIEERNQHLEALRSACVGRQKGRRKTDKLGGSHGRADPRDAPAVYGRLGSVCQVYWRARLQLPPQALVPATFSLRQWIGKWRWLRELENVSLEDGVFLLRWTGGGVKYRRYVALPVPTCRHLLSP